MYKFVHFIIFKKWYNVHNNNVSTKQTKKTVLLEVSTGRMNAILILHYSTLLSLNKDCIKQQKWIWKMIIIYKQWTDEEQHITLYHYQQENLTILDQIIQTNIYIYIFHIKINRRRHYQLAITSIFGLETETAWSYCKTKHTTFNTMWWYIKCWHIMRYRYMHTPTPEDVPIQV